MGARVSFVILILCTMRMVTPINFNLIKGEKRLLRWNIIPKEDLIIEADFALA